jgi:hypothetical protein
MSSPGVAPRAAVSVSNARAEASRKNGAKSRGPKTPEGKARSSRNALKHGLRAERFLVLADEDAAAFEALQAALLAELAPVGAVQTVLAQRVVSAAWRLGRADEIEAGILRERRHSDGGLGLAVLRDANGPRAFPTLPRYRGAALAEFLRCLRLLQARQAEARTIEAPAGPGRHAPAEPTPLTPPGRIAARPAPTKADLRREPNEPEALSNAARPVPEFAQFPARVRARPRQPEPHPLPNEPEALGNPGGAEPVPTAALARLQRDLDQAMQAAERGGMRLGATGAAGRGAMRRSR